MKIKLLYVMFDVYLNVSRGISALQNFGISAAICLVIIANIAVGILTWKLFELVTAIPDRILRWVGQLLQHLGDEGRGLAHQAQGDLKHGLGEAGSVLGKLSNNRRDAESDSESGQRVGKNQNANAGEAKSRDQIVNAEAGFEVKSNTEDKRWPR